MSSPRSINVKKEDRLSRFGQRLQSLSDSFYSTILEDSKEKKVPIKNAKDFEEFNSNDFTFDEYSNNEITSNDNFSFTFHSLDQSNNKRILDKHQRTRINHSSTPYSIREENFIEKPEEETLMVRENRCSHGQPILVGYYPVITYQPLCLPPNIYLSDKQIQSQINDYSTLTKVTPIKKT